MITPSVFLVGDGVAFSTDFTPDLTDMESLKKEYFGSIHHDKIGALRNIKLYDGKHVVGEALEFQNTLLSPIRNMLVFCVIGSAAPMLLYVENITSSLLKNVSATAVVLGVTGEVSFYVPKASSQLYF